MLLEKELTIRRLQKKVDDGGVAIDETQYNTFQDTFSEQNLKILFTFDRIR